MLNSPRIVIFCDGACSGNPGPGGWGAVVATPDGQVRELGGGAAGTTNNQMELTAAIEALASVAPLEGEAVVYTDSIYLIKGITQWIWNWRRNGWKAADGRTEVANRSFWEKLFSVSSPRGKGIQWKYVPGHSGVAGNDRVDAIAVAFSKGQVPALYRGPLASYSVPLQVEEGATAPQKSQAKKGSAFSYLSLVDKVPMRHASWGECEKRVKGKSGAKYKKAMSRAEEDAILREWGVSLV
jgi:ribonuclease HI